MSDTTERTNEPTAANFVLSESDRQYLSEMVAKRQQEKQEESPGRQIADELRDTFTEVAQQPEDSRQDNQIDDQPANQPAEQVTDRPSFSREEPWPLERSRVTILWGVYLQQPGSDIFTVESRYAYSCSSDEQPWKRILTLSQQWVPLDKGWLTMPSLLAILNEEGKLLRRTPSEEEAKDIAQRVIEVGILPAAAGHRTMRSPANEPVPFAQVPPGRGVQLEPLNLGQYHLRCRQGTARCVIHLFP